VTGHIDPPNATVLPAHLRNRPVYGPQQPVEEQLRETQQDLAASQADLTRVEQERDWERQVVAMLRKNGVTSARVIRERNAERNLLRAELASARAELDLLRPRLDVAELELHKARMTLRAVAAEPGWQDVSPPKDSPPIPAGDTNKEIQ
jgi:hypothetical protein